MKKQFYFLSLPLLALTLNACNDNIIYLNSNDPGTATIRIYKDNNSSSKSRYISPKNVELEFTYNDLSGVLSNNENVCPSIGDVNILVIPVHLPGERSVFNTPEIKEDIEKVFFGENDHEIGFYSLKEYFYQSSFGKLNFSGFVTDWFDVSEHTNVKTLSDLTMGSSGTIITEILRKGVDWAFSTYNLSKNDYDQNKDGSIDAVWMVYDHHNFFTQDQLDYRDGIMTAEEDLNSSFWNYTSWDYSTLPSLENPTTSAFSWASFDQMYLSYASYDQDDIALLDNLNSIPLDSHTFIHETGHLLGLEDFYADNNFRPAGSSTMMDQNVGDLDSYSKMLLGWIKPYVVYGTSEILLEEVTKNDYSVIVIPANYEEISATIENLHRGGDLENFVYKFNPFSEYLMIDLYSPKGLNALDSGTRLIHGRGACLSTTGVRIYHVDSRIFKCSVVNYDGGQALNYVDGYVWDGKSLANDEAILMPISNSMIESSSYQLPQSFDYFEQIRLLEASGTNTFDRGTYASNTSTLWFTSSQDFDIYNFGYQFFNGSYTFNGGQAIPFKVGVKTLKEAL